MPNMTYLQAYLVMDWYIKSVNSFLRIDARFWRYMYRSSLLLSTKHVKASQHVKMLGMDDVLKQKVHYSLPGGVLLALYDGKVTLYLAGFQEDASRASTETRRNFKLALDNRLNFEIGLVSITGIDGRLKLRFCHIARDEFLMHLLDRVNPAGSTAHQQTLTILPKSTLNSMSIQIGEFIKQCRRHFSATLINQVSLSNNIAGSGHGIDKEPRYILE